MKLGTNEKWKVQVLSVLGAVCLYLVYANVLSGPSGAPADAGRAPGATATAPPPTTPTPVNLPADQAAPRRAGVTSSRNEKEFTPVLRSKKPEDRVDPTQVDPTLRLELLAKVQAVDAAGGKRNLFQMGTPPLRAAALPPGPETVVRPPIGPRPPAPPTPPGPEPPPPPLPFKFYGFSTVRNNGKKTVFFLEGDDILIAAEGDTLKRRYRIVRIGPTSVLLEDTESKRQQTLPLSEEAPS